MYKGPLLKVKASHTHTHCTGLEVNLSLLDLRASSVSDVQGCGSESVYIVDKNKEKYTVWTCSRCITINICGNADEFPHYADRKHHSAGITFHITHLLLKIVVNHCIIHILVSLFWSSQTS